MAARPYIYTSAPRSPRLYTQTRRGRNKGSYRSGIFMLSRRRNVNHALRSPSSFSFFLSLSLSLRRRLDRRPNRRNALGFKSAVNWKRPSKRKINSLSGIMLVEFGLLLLTSFTEQCSLKSSLILVNFFFTIRVSLRPKKNFLAILSSKITTELSFFN